MAEEGCGHHASSRSNPFTEALQEAFSAISQMAGLASTARRGKLQAEAERP